MYTIYLSWSTVKPGDLPYMVQGLAVLLHLLEVPSGLASGEVVVQVIGPGHTDGKGMKDGGTTIEVLRESLRQLFDCSEMINRIHY